MIEVSELFATPTNNTMLRRQLLLSFMKTRPLARQLAQVYGQSLTQIVYIQTTALLGRLRLNALADVERTLLPRLLAERRHP